MSESINKRTPARFLQNSIYDNKNFTTNFILVLIENIFIFAANYWGISFPTNIGTGNFANPKVK